MKQQTEIVIWKKSLEVILKNNFKMIKKNCHENAR